MTPTSDGATQGAPRPGMPREDGGSPRPKCGKDDARFRADLSDKWSIGDVRPDKPGADDTQLLTNPSDELALDGDRAVILGAAVGPDRTIRNPRKKHGQRLPAASNRGVSRAERGASPGSTRTCGRNSCTYHPGHWEIPRRQTAAGGSNDVAEQGPKRSEPRRPADSEQGNSPTM
jgi:hypothetical protein